MEPLKSFAVCDAPSRHRKARKIARILRVRLAAWPQQRPRVLDAGTGSGLIGEWLAQDGWEVYGIDTRLPAGLRIPCCCYDGRHMPFADASFDVILSNHVLEHTGDWQAQRDYIAELRRVLKPGGIGYFAAPNRWALIEPHYKIPLLGALPRKMADCLAGGRYDCYPRSHAQYRVLFEAAGFAVEDCTAEAARLYLEELRIPGWRMWMQMPDWLLRSAVRLMPTLCFLLRRN